MSEKRGLTPVMALLEALDESLRGRFLSCLLARSGATLVGIGPSDSLAFSYGPLWDDDFSPIAPFTQPMSIDQAVQDGILPKSFEFSYRRYLSEGRKNQPETSKEHWQFFELSGDMQKNLKGESLPKLVGLFVTPGQVDLEELSDRLKSAYKILDDQMRALNASAIVAITDAKGVINYVNDTFCRISGYSREELLGQTHSMVNSGHHEKNFFQQLWRTISRGEIWKGEICNRSKSGEIYWVETTIVPFLDDKSHRPKQYVSIRNDITSQKKALASLEQERMRSWHKEKMVSLGEMAAGLAHELGNPAASISAWLDALDSQLQRNVSADELVKFQSMIPKVKADVGRIKSMIQGMLVYARDGSLDNLDSERFDHVVKLVEDYCIHRLKKLNVSFHYQSSQPYLEIICRLSELVQVLVNLILNACDAVQDLKEGSRWVRISAKKDANEVTITVDDGGAGVPLALQEKIWDPFFTTKKAGAGTGLGLSISKSIIEKHGGSMCFNPRASCSSFVIKLPSRKT